MKNPEINGTFNVLSVAVVQAGQVTLITNWVISAFRILFFGLKGKYKIVVT